MIVLQGRCPLIWNEKLTRQTRRSSRKRQAIVGAAPALRLGETITMVRARFLWRSSWDGEIRRDLEARWGSMCPSCTSEDERASAPERLVCEGCSQPLATPSVHIRVCSDRCAKRWRRRRKSARRPFVACGGCAKRFRLYRHDARFCSNACRQSAYRRRQATGEPIKPPAPVDEGTHLDNIAGVLHYAGIPIISIDRLTRAGQATAIDTSWRFRTSTHGSPSPAKPACPKGMAAIISLSAPAAGAGR